MRTFGLKVSDFSTWMAVAVVSETFGGAGQLGSAIAAVGILTNVMGVIALLWAMIIAPAYSAPFQLNSRHETSALSARRG